LAFRGGLLASSEACRNPCCRVLLLGVTGRVSCLCALRVPPSRKAMAGRAARPHCDCLPRHDPLAIAGCGCDWEQETGEHGEKLVGAD
jgi:hypothetical protein